MSDADLENEFNVDELLAGRALGNLSEQETKQLGSLLTRSPGQDSEEFDYVLAALSLRGVETEELPNRVRDAVRIEALTHLPKPKQVYVARRRIPRRELLAWTVAMACSLLLALQWLPLNSPQNPSIAEQRTELIATSADLIEAPWTPGTHPFKQQVSGDVVWSNTLQKGYLRFTNMPVNDPAAEQYQLWIIDPQRDDKPIDGGVFDISKSGEVIVPINAKLGVVNPQAFAVTIEKPGGVVVSSQDNLPLLAEVDA
jgi:hypothetical protein